VAAGQCAITFGSRGSKTLTASYAGDSSFSSSVSSGEAHTVNGIGTTTTLTSEAPDPSVVGQAVTAQYAVTPQGAGTPTGNVVVSNGTDSCTGTVAAGQCALILTGAGATSLTASYAGDASFVESTSSAVPHQVNRANTTTTITSEVPDPSTVGEPVTVSFTVVAESPGGGTPTGNVTVSDGVDSCTGTAASGQCSLALTKLGERTLTATSTGDSNFVGSTSTGMRHQVRPRTTKIWLPWFFP
jgi:hypothetical protein